MTIIAGLDIGGNATAMLFCLDHFPDNITQYWQKNQSKAIKLKPNKQGVKRFLSHQPNVIILEPTGVWYALFWYRVCEVHGIDVKWMSHADLKAKRSSYGFTRKDDETDALCLAATYFDPTWINRFGQDRYLNFYPKTIHTIRELVLEIEQLDKLRGLLICQSLQRFSYEYPEAANQKHQRSKNGLTPIFQWLTGKYNYTKRVNDYQNSIAHQLGIDLSLYTVNHAQLINLVERQLTENEAMLKKALKNPLFKPYLQAFEPFCFSDKMAALIIYKIFPFDNFLIDGQPFIEWVDQGNSKTRRNRSLQWFQAYLGFKRSLERSGKGEELKWGGSKMMRSHFYAWTMARIARNEDKRGRLATQIGQKLGDKWDKLKSSRVGGKDAMIRVSFYATRLLFYALRDNLRV